MGCKECRTKPCCDAQEVECCSKCFHFNECTSACDKASTTKEDIKNYAKQFEETNKKVDALFHELQSKGYNCKEEYSISFYQHEGLTKENQISIKFTDLKCSNNSLSIDVKMYRDRNNKQWYIHLWKYEKGQHIFRDLDANINEWNIENYIKEIDEFYYGKLEIIKPPKEESNQISIFDLL